MLAPWACLVRDRELAHRRTEALGAAPCALGGGAGKDERELFTPVACRQIGGAPYHALERASDLRQARVALLVPVAIVVGLEEVDVAQQERERFAAPWCTRNLGLEVLVEAAAVANARQWVGAREALELAGERDALRHVDSEAAHGRSDAVGAGDREAYAGEVARTAGRGYGVRLVVDALTVENAAIAGDEAGRDVRREHLGVGAADRGFVLDAEDAEAIGAPIDVTVVAILHVEDRRDVREDGLELGALAGKLALELSDTCAQASDLVVVAHVATPSSRRWSRRSIRSIEERLPIRWAWSIAAKRCVCSIMRRSGRSSSIAM